MEQIILMEEKEIGTNYRKIKLSHRIFEGLEV